jgi:CheY-like chemotaxis protein
VLVADDQEIICELIAEYLRADGHEVTLALNGTEALEKFKAGNFEVLVTDQSMPGLSGVQLASAVKTARPGLPVILLTGFGDEMLASGKLPPEVDLVVSKPVSSMDLRRALARAVTGEK